MWYDKMSGIQLTRDNAKRVAKWVEGEAHFVKENGEDMVFVIANTPRGDVMIREGDWIAKDVDERFRIVRIDEMDLDETIKKSQNRRNVLQVSARNFNPPSN